MEVIRLENVLSILKEYSDFKGELKYKLPIKPSHGMCCTCQDCGYDHDNCVCLHNEIVEWIKCCVIEI